MYGIFHFLRRRVAKRRFVAVWLCLVAVELFCPALCDDQTYAATTSNSSQTEISFSTNSKSDASETSLSACDDRARHAQSTICNDECLCHATAIPSIVVGMKSASIQTYRITPYFGESIFNSLPPPYLPPKLS